MKVNRMHLDGPLNSKPEGATLQNRNTIIREKPGAWTGEPGTSLLGDLGKLIMGEIQLPNNTKLLFLSTDELVILNGNGFYSLRTSSIFNFTKPIHGRAAYNHRNEIVVVWTDGTTPRYLNLSKVPTTITADNISLNIFKVNPHVDIQVTSEIGSLLSGVYYPMIQGITEEDSLTSWIVYEPVKVFTQIASGIDHIEGQKSGVVTNKGIRLSITSGEYTSYNYGYIYKKDGELFAYSVGKAGTSYTYTGSEVKATVTIDEALLERAYYSNVGLIETLGNVLYLADLETYAEPDIQQQVNLINITWTSALVSVDTLKLNTQQAGFMPGEIYALYFRYIYKWGRGSWYPIPGRERLVSDTNFLTQDTANIIGRTNYWENQDELYPDEARWGTVRNKKVRHHGLPSLNWLRTNVHTGVDVGVNYLPRLSFQLNNVPANADSIGWELGYAERTPNNSLVLGQSPVINTVYDINDTISVNKYSSIGANLLTQTSTDGFEIAAVEGHLFRVHPFELMLGSTAQAQSFRKEYKLTSGNFTITRKVRRPPAAPTPDEFIKPYSRMNALIDYRSGSVTTTTDNQQLATFDYVPKDTYFKRIDNFSLERTYILDTNGVANPFPVTSPLINPTTTTQYTEQTYLITLLTNNKNCYKSFDRQEIVVAGTGNNYIGDCYATEYTYHTYGKKRSNEQDFQLYDAGLIFARRLVLYSVHPIALRYTNAASNQYTQYYPKEVVADYTDSWKVDVEPNGFSEGFNKDFSALNDIEPGVFFNPNKQHKFVDGITRSQIYQSTENWFGWRDLRLNDFLIIPTANGRITNLAKKGDLMYVHLEGDLYLTRGGEELQLVGKKVTYVGSGDIFTATPEEVVNGKYGALGLAHRLCATMTDYGYCFVDTAQGIGAVYLVDGKDVKILSDNGMVEFFRNNLYLLTHPNGSKTIQLGYDPVYKRLLITHKGKLPIDLTTYRGEYHTDMMLQEGDVVFKDNKFVRVTNIIAE